MAKRQFTAYEINQLTKHGLDPFSLAEIISLNIPVEYITCYAEFKGNDFVVDPAVLIPRVETEDLIDIAVDKVKQKNSVIFCDIGTGSGAIGISFALQLEKKDIRYYGILSDVSKNALSITGENIENLLPTNNSLKLLQSDLLANYPDIQFDIIFANLPYIPSNRINELDCSVKDFEPKIALDGGKDGLKYIRQLLDQATKFLKPNGVILLEVDDSHTDASEFSKNWSVDIKLDSNSKNRFWIIHPKG